MKKALDGTWEGFQHMSDNAFLNVFNGGRGRRGGGTGAPAAPDVWTDERFAHLSMSDKLRLDGDADTYTTSVFKQIEDQMIANADELRAKVAIGQATADDIDRAIEEGAIRIADQAGLYNLHAEKRQDDAAAEKFAGQAAAGYSLANTKENRDASQTLLENAGVYQGLQQGNPEAATQFLNLFGKSGVISDEVGSLLGQMSNSTDPRKIAYGLDTLAEMRAKNPNAFAAGLPTELAEQTYMWATMKRYTAPDEQGALLESFANRNTPEGRRAAKERREAVPELLSSRS
jgi:hypothetical protein